MSTESTTRKRLPDITAKDVRFVCIANNLVVFEYDDHGEERRISFRMNQIDMALAEAKFKSMTDEEKQAELEENFRQSQEPNECDDFDPQDNS